MLPEVEVILPCYNPTPRWVNELRNFYKLASPLYSVKFIVVNDGSQSIELPQQINQLINDSIPLTFLSYELNKGKGYALRFGVENTVAPFILYTDVDFPFENNSTLEVLDSLVKKRANVVAGFRSDQYYSNNMSLFRQILSRSFRFFLKHIIKLPVTDTQCGLKAFDKVGKQVFLSTTINRYLFDFEFIYRCSKSTDIHLVTQSVKLKENVVFSKMKPKILVQESLNLLRVLWSTK